MRGYREQLQRDLPRWREAGWVTTHGEAAILKDAAAHGGGIGLAQVLATLAAVLLGFAIMSFVASNWAEMPNWLRIAILFGSVAASYATAAVLFENGLDGFGHAAVLAGAAAFGASIMLIGQMYHLGGYPPHAVAMWAAGAVAAGALIRSNATLALAMVLVVLWGGWEFALTNNVYWEALIGWAAVTAAFYYQRWWPGAHLSALSLTAFIIHAALSASGPHRGGMTGLDFITGGWILVQLGLLVAVIGVFGDRAVAFLNRIGPLLLGYGAVVAFFGLYSLQFFNDVPGYGAAPFMSGLVPIAVLTLALAIGAVVWGLRTHNRALVWIGYLAFSIEILGLYFKTIGSLLSTSAFFLSAAILVAALAVVAYRLHARQTTPEAQT
jgi:uncharacterized membrane protein